MALTVTNNTTTSAWSATISEADFHAALHAGLQALYPADVPAIDFGEAGDKIVIRRASGEVVIWSGGDATLTVEITDVEPAA